MTRYVIFKIGEEYYGLDVLLVMEIARDVEIVPVAGAPFFVRGLHNMRNQIVTAVDLGMLFDNKPATITPDTRFIVLKTTAELSMLHLDRDLTEGSVSDRNSLLVDSVEEIVSVDDSEGTPKKPAMRGTAQEFFSGLVKVGSNHVLILSIRDILNCKIETNL